MVLLAALLSLALPKNANTESAPVAANPVWLGEMGGWVFFIANIAPGDGGAALFKTDGTTAGTSQVAPIDGFGVLAYQAGKLFISTGSKAYFLANTTAAGQEVWVTDGTTAGTHQVADIYQGQNTLVSPALLGLIGTDLIFAEDTTDNSMQLFRTDGTTAGTHTLSKFASSRYGTVSDSLAINGKFYLVLQSSLTSGNVDLWVTDGTQGGTLQIDSNEGYPWHLNPSSLQAFGNSVALLTNTEYEGNELSFVNTTTNALTILDGVEGPGSGASPGTTIAAMDGFILFLRGDPGDGVQLWRSDGTLPGTTLVKTLGSGVQFSHISWNIAVTRVGNRAIFQSENAEDGPQLWSSDGTAAGTVPLIDTPEPSYYGQPLLGVAGTHGYYAINSGADLRVVVTDGTPAGTHALAAAGPLDPGELLNTQIAGDDNLAFIYTYYDDDASGTVKHLYAYRPKTQVLTHLRDSVLGLAEDNPPQVDAGLLYFESSDAAHSEQPWVSDGTPGGTRILADLDGNAPLTVSPTSVSLPSTAVGVRSSAKMVTLTNIGLSTVTFRAITLGGPQADDFSFSTTCGTTLMPGASCTLSVTFQPVSAGVKAANISIADDAPGSPQSVVLGGTGTAAASIKLSAGSLAFANESPGSTSAPKTITVTNSGGSSLLLNSVRVTGSEADDFMLVNACGSALAAGASCTLSVTFKPVSAGVKSAQVTLADNASGSPHSVALSGAGTLAGAELKLSAASLVFAAEAPGTASAAQKVTLTNSGTATLTLSSITVGGAQADDFILSKTCGSSLAPAASCTVSIVFKPVSAGDKAAAVSILDDAGNSPQRISVSGTGN